MTDNDIINALEEMAEYSDFLEDIRVAENALNLINRQKAEIERLKDEIRITQEYIHRNNLEYDLLAFSLAKKRLRDDLAKEMAGDSDATEKELTRKVIQDIIKAIKEGVKNG